MTAAPPPSPSKWRLRLMRGLALAFVIGISVGIFIFRDQLHALEQFGYPGIFLLNVLTSATIVLPAPGLTIVFAMGAVFHPFWVGVASGLGASVGEMSGYLAGMSGQGLIENQALFDRIADWVRRYGGLPIILLAFLPLPIFDLAGIAAGMLKMKPQNFLFYCALGKIPKMLVVAYAGAYSLDWVLHVWGSTPTP